MTRFGHTGFPDPQRHYQLAPTRDPDPTHWPEFESTLLRRCRHKICKIAVMLPGHAQHDLGTDGTAALA
jgi:hypothetical protein